MNSKDFSRMAPDKLDNQKIYRAEAAKRERARMRTITAATDELQNILPLPEHVHKLPTFQTLRLAINYITALQNMLESDKEPTPQQFLKTLSNGLSSSITKTLTNAIRIHSCQPAPTPLDSSFSASQPQNSVSFSNCDSNMALKDFSPMARDKYDIQKVNRVMAADWERDHRQRIAKAMETLRDVLPIPKQELKLSYFDSLLLASNYIATLQKMLEVDEEPTPQQFLQTLSNGLSIRATETLAKLVQIHSCQLAPIPLDASSLSPQPQTSSSFSNCNMKMDSADFPHMAPDKFDIQEIYQVMAADRKRDHRHRIAKAMETLRDVLPMPRWVLKLCQFETLQLASNYIGALRKMLDVTEQPTPQQFLQALSNGLSLNNKNTLADLIQIQSSQLEPYQSLPSSVPLQHYSPSFSTTKPSDSPPE